MWTSTFYLLASTEFVFSHRPNSSCFVNSSAIRIPSSSPLQVLAPAGVPGGMLHKQLVCADAAAAADQFVRFLIPQLIIIDISILSACLCSVHRGIPYYIPCTVCRHRHRLTHKQRTQKQAQFTRFMVFISPIQRSKLKTHENSQME